MNKQEQKRTLSDMSYKSHERYNYIRTGIGVLKFEFRPTEWLGITASCGSLYYEHQKVKENYTGGKTHYNKNNFNFSFNNGFGFGLRYRF